MIDACKQQRAHARSGCLRLSVYIESYMHCSSCPAATSAHTRTWGDTDWLGGGSHKCVMPAAWKVQGVLDELFHDVANYASEKQNAWQCVLWQIRIAAWKVTAAAAGQHSANGAHALSRPGVQLQHASTL